MKVEEFLDISDYEKYLITYDGGQCLSETLDKYETMKTCGLDTLIKVNYKLQLCKNEIEVICVLQIKSEKE